MLTKLWQEWLEIARHIGSFNARALITLVYFTFIAPFGVLVRLFSDPLHLKHQTRPPSTWEARDTRDLDLEQARRQG